MVMKGRLKKVILVGIIVFSGAFILEGLRSECAAREEYKIHIHGAAQQTNGQYITFGWGDLINKNSSWLRTTVSEELAPGISVPLFVMKPAVRKTDVMFAICGQPQAWSRGLPPLSPKTPYKTWKVICKTLTAPAMLVTSDPKIKTIHDLKGKKISCLPRMSTAGIGLLNIIEHGAGLKGKIKIDFLGPPPAKDALLSGLIDAAHLPFGSADPTWIFPGIAVEIRAAKKLHFVDLTKEAIDKTYKKVKWPYMPPIQVPAGKFTPDQKAFWTFGIPNYYACDKELPDDVVYEMLNIMYDHIGEFKNYHAVGKALTRERMGDIAVPVEGIHPAAIKFFKEKGIKYGMY
ncbi:TAXI family TRAP transporter solute-binding subunit [Thermodesulfobacteriota bacterium]